MDHAVHTCKKAWLLLVLLLIASGSGACDDDDDDTESQTTDDDTSADDDDNDDSSPAGDDDDDDTVEVLWGECPSYVGSNYECAMVEAPFDYAQPDGERLDIFVYRHVSQSATPKGQLWLLEGGPGGSGVDFVPLLDQVLIDRYPDYDFYSLDHRGVGNSTRFGCPQEDNALLDVGACVASLESQWGDKLPFFTSTNAARDLGRMIELTREEDKPVYVYGVSYGTYWAQRYLQIFPDQADAVILDSLAMPTLCYIDNYDYLFNENGRLIMNFCEADATCSAKLGTIAASPWEALGAIYEKIDTGALCAELSDIDRELTRTALGVMEMDWFLRVLIPPLAYRFNRCSAADVTAINSLLDYLNGKAGKTDWVDVYHLESSILGVHVILSEMWDDTPFSEIEAIHDEAYFSIDTSYFFGQIADMGVWPTYGDDGYFDKFADTATPILMLNGTLDPQTPLSIAAPMAEIFNGPHQQFVTVPWSPHCVLGSSWTEAALEGTGPICGEEIIFDFLDDPTGTVDTSCLDELYPLEFDPTSEINIWISEELFGTDDMWEGDPNAAKAGGENPLSPLIERSVRASLRHALGE